MDGMPARVTEPSRVPARTVTNRPSVPLGTLRQLGDTDPGQARAREHEHDAHEGDDEEAARPPAPRRHDVGVPVRRPAQRPPRDDGPDAGQGRGRSEERRVGKEWRSRWSPYHYKKKKPNYEQYQPDIKDIPHKTIVPA